MIPSPSISIQSAGIRSQIPPLPLPSWAAQQIWSSVVQDAVQGPMHGVLIACAKGRDASLVPRSR